MATEFVMPAVEFMEDYEPTPQTRGRKAEDNPFTATVEALAGTYNVETKRSKHGAKLVFPMLERTRVTAKFGRAAKAAGYSPRFDDKANEGPNAVIVAYLVEKITHKPRVAKGLTVTNVADNNNEQAEQKPVLETSGMGELLTDLATHVSGLQVKY